KHDKPDPERSGLFFFLNTNKRSIVLDLEDAADRESLLRVAATADLVVESFPPETMSRLGLDHETLLKVRPGIGLVSISNFGQTGPYRDFKGSELTLYAMGAEMHSVGLQGREPLKQAGSSGLLYAGTMAAVAAMAVLM